VSRLSDVVIDCVKPAPLARFWAAALDGYEVAPYDEAELARLREMGIQDPEDDPFVLVLSSAEGRPRLFFQKVPEGKVVKNRLHMALAAPDRLAEVKRLEALGARAVEEVSEGGNTWTNMEDPEGNEFCVSQA
jgi:predicted enzyme related to lactoylglutathione lyase